MKTYPAERCDIKCPDCGGLMVLRKSPKYKSPFYGCSQYPTCVGSHGAHPDGGPLGVPANQETKEWRIKAHDSFDTLWHCSVISMTRKRAYKLLAETMGMDEVHIGEADIDMCKTIITVSNELIEEFKRK